MKKDIDSNSIYNQYITYLQRWEFTWQQNLRIKQRQGEKHHILPFHAGGKKEGLTVFCTPREHALAHYYRFLVYRQKGDYIAYILMLNQKLAPRERGLLAAEKNKGLKNLFWDPKWQSEQGKKSKKRSKTKNQILATKQIGLKYGSKNGIKNQSSNLKQILKRKTTWLYFFQDKQYKFVFEPQISFSNLARILQAKTQDLNTTIVIASFYKVIYGQRKQMYGWQLMSIEIDFD